MLFRVKNNIYHQLQKIYSRYQTDELYYCDFAIYLSNKSYHTNELIKC